MSLRHADAFAFLEESTETFDVAVIDVPDPLEGGPACLLYTREFYELLRSRLNPGGAMVAQSGPTGPAFYRQCFAAVANTIASVFPKSYLSEAFVPSFGATWGFVIGSLGAAPTSLSAVEVDERLAARVARVLRYYDGITHRGMFSVPRYLREAQLTEDRIITRDSPLVVP